MYRPNAYMNWGRWLVNCPDCGSALHAGARLVCPVCFPNVRAKAFKPAPGGLFRPVPDVELIAQATAQAEKAGKVIVPVFPDERAEIERVLRGRKARNMNWEPGESLEYLIADNIEHGDPVPGGLANGL